MLYWSDIDTVLLDMDGTLLDLHFDSYFWLEHLPLRYAEIHSVTPEQARTWLHQRITEQQGTLNWYCLDFWSQTLDLDIVALKREIKSRIAFRPYVKEFLQALRMQQKRVVIVTNAHRDSLNLKLEELDLEHRVDHIISSHDYGVPKEQQAFWHHLQQEEPFNPQRTLLVDDSLAVLESARTYGIHFLLSIIQPDSQQAARTIEQFSSIADFDQIIPEDK